MRSLKWMLVLAAFGATAWASVAAAEDTRIPIAYLDIGADSPMAVYTAASRSDGEDSSVTSLGESVDNASLAGASGGTLVIQKTNLTGTVTGDTANHVVAGDNTITGFSFAGEAGIPVVIQNSGSNVLIQNATVLNIEFKP